MKAAIKGLRKTPSQPALNPSLAMPGHRARRWRTPCPCSAPDHRSTPPQIAARAFPAVEMYQEMIRQGNGWLAFLRLTLACGAAVEHAAVKIDPAMTDGNLQGGAAYRSDFARMIERAVAAARLAFKVHPHMSGRSASFMLANKGHVRARSKLTWSKNIHHTVRHAELSALQEAKTHAQTVKTADLSMFM